MNPNPNNLFTSAPRGGALIYCNSSDGVFVLLVKSSNPDFGGPDFQIPKGVIDKGESPWDAAYREAREEAGLLRNNVKGYNFLVDHNNIRIFVIEVKNMKDFGDHDFEVAETKWFSLTEAFKIIRPWQKTFLVKLVKYLRDRKNIQNPL